MLFDFIFFSNVFAHIPIGQNAIRFTTSTIQHNLFFAFNLNFRVLEFTSGGRVKAPTGILIYTCKYCNCW